MVTAETKAKKKWFTIVARGAGIELGKVPAFEPNTLIGRTVQTNLSFLTKDPKKQNVNIKFKITEASQNDATADISSYELVPSFIRRIIRKGKEKLEISFASTTKDAIKVRIKLLLVTKIAAKRSVNKELRKKVQELITDITVNSTYDEFIKKIISNKIHRDVKATLSKIYPLSLFEVKALKRI